MTRNYWIVFKNTDHWWRILFKDKFSHVYVIYRDFDGFWRVWNPLETSLDDSYVFWDNIEQNKLHVPDLLRKRGEIVVKITKEYARSCFPRVRWYHLKPGYSYNCMKSCCWFLRIKPCGLTPYRFYKNLIRLSRCENSLERYRMGLDNISFTG